MSKHFNSVYDLARYMQNEHRISEWDVGCFLRSVDKIIHPMVIKQQASYNNLDIVASKKPGDDNSYNITFADKRESIDVKINGTTIQILPKELSLF